MNLRSLIPGLPKMPPTLDLWAADWQPKEWPIGEYPLLILSVDDGDDMIPLINRTNHTVSFGGICFVETDYDDSYTKISGRRLLVKKMLICSVEERDKYADKSVYSPSGTLSERAIPSDFHLDDQDIENLVSRFG